MERVDFRKLPMGEQEGLRRKAIYWVIEEKRNQRDVANLIGVSYQTVNEWAQKYRKAGGDCVRDQRREPTREYEKILSPKEITQIKEWMKEKHPDQLKLPFALWTAQAIKGLVWNKFKKKIGLSTIQKYMKLWGYTPQKPVIQAKERQDAKVQQWLTEEYPKIAKRARREKAAIHWGDETGVQNQDVVGRTYALKGQTPVVKRTTKHFKMSMISTVTNRGEMRFMIYEGALNVALFIEFLEQLIKDSKRKVFLILDNLKVHHAKKVQEWTSAQKEKIELFFLPPYSPEYNPDEYLNNDLKQQLRQKPFPKDIQALTKGMKAILKTIQSNPQRVRSYFNPEWVQYAA